MAFGSPQDSRASHADAAGIVKRHVRSAFARPGADCSWRPLAYAGNRYIMTNIAISMCSSQYNDWHAARPHHPAPMATPTATSGYHATDGAAYEIFLGRWTRRLAPLLLDFAEFSGAGRLIDVGCGTGSVACAMATRWPKRAVIGIDVAAPYIAFARGEQRLDNLTFAQAHAAQLPYADASFDGAAAQLVLNFVPDPVAALVEMQRVTAPGGRLAASVWDFRGGLVYQRMFWDTAAGLDPQAAAGRDRLFSGALALPDGLVELFEQCGLRQVERASLTIRMDYASFDDYWQPLLGGQGPVGTYAAGLADGLRARIESAVRASYLSGAPDGPRSLTATAWAVRGVVPRG
jgi:trans-aconitate methyltransferase